MRKKKLYERFQAAESLNFLYDKIDFLFDHQLYIITVLNEAIRRSRMVAILGREGMGKSTAIAQFMKKIPNVYYLRIGNSYAIKNFFNEMLYQISGEYPKVHQSLFIQMKLLSSHLTANNSKNLIIIDDAGQLKARALSIFFELRENTRFTTGFVFVGLDYFQKGLLKAMSMGVPGIAEFYRRVENWYRIPMIKKTEKAEYAKEHGLNDDQIQNIVQENPITISQLEFMVNAIIEEAEVSEKEEREPNKIKILGNQRMIDRNVSEDDQIEDDDDDQFEETNSQKRKESAKRAGLIKKNKSQMKYALNEVTS